MSVVETALTDRQPQNSSADDVYDDGYLRVEHRNYYMACAGQSIFLPRSEFLIISRLVRSIERVVSADELWRSAWGEEKPFNSESLHVYIYRLRNKLMPHKLQVDTVVNVGYRLLPPRGAVVREAVGSSQTVREGV
jgi:two-component system alkaline phosphatase synthesis response regulator PhoP